VLRREAPPTNVDAVVASPSEVRRMTYRAGLLAAVLSLLGGEPAVNGALHAQAVDACTVLTLQELSSAAGVSSAPDPTRRRREIRSAASAPGPIR
jgi:hypothetical protein